MYLNGTPTNDQPIVVTLKRGGTAVDSANVAVGGSFSFTVQNGDFVKFDKPAGGATPSPFACSGSVGDNTNAGDLRLIDTANKGRDVLAAIPAGGGGYSFSDLTLAHKIDVEISA